MPPTSRFAHMSAHVASQVFQPTAEWSPPTWVSTSVPAPVLRCVRLTETNERFARANLNPRIRQVRQRSDGKYKARDLADRRERTIILAIIGGVVDWDNVFEAPDPEKKIEVGRAKMAFPTIGEEQADPGVQTIRELLAVLGPQAELDFIAWAHNDSNWKHEDEDDGEDDGEPGVPLPRPSPIA